MRRELAAMGLGLGVCLLGGCGSTAPSAAGTATPPSAWRTDLLTRAQATHQLAASVAVTQVYSGAPLPVTAAVDVNGATFREDVLTSTGQQLTVVDTGQTTFTYWSGDVAYGVTPSWQPDGYDVTWLTVRFADFLQGLRFQSVRSRPNNLVSIGWTGTLPNGSAASGTLRYNTATHAPVSLVANFTGGSIRIVVTHYNTAPTFGASTFQFTAPPGTVGMDGSVAELESLTAVSASLPYTVDVPSQRSLLALTRVGAVDATGYGRELVMQFTDQAGNPVLVTEYDSALRPPLPTSAFPTQIDGHPVEEVAQGSTVEDVLYDAATTIVAEGQADDLSTLVNNLTALPSAGNLGG
jgi:hypothetical protein